MFSSFLGSFGVWLVLLMGMCRAGNVQASGSSLSPLSIVYTVYPYYNSEATLLGVVKAAEEQPPRSALGADSEATPDMMRNGKNATPNEEPINSGHSSESTHRRAEQQLTEITYWPPVQSAGYSVEEQDVIKRTINTGTLEELKSYSISAARLKKLIAYRDKNLGFKTVDEILLFQGIDIDVLDKFCKSIVRKKQPSKSLPVSLKGDILTPPLDDHMRMMIDTCTGIWVCGKVVSWARLDMKCNLLEWNCENLGEISMKDGLVAIVDLVARTVARVGPSDVYIMEEDPVVPFSRINSSVYYLNLQRQQINASIATMLGTRQHQSNDDASKSDLRISNIYMMRSRTPARLFNLLIGSENVSAESVVKKLLRVTQGLELEKENHMTMFAQVDPDLKMYYESRDSFQREQMNWALLLIIAFVNLSVIRNSATLQKIAKGGSRKKL